MESMHAVNGDARQNTPLLQQLLADLSKTEEFANRIRAVEHEADKVCQQTMEMLHRSFITPIDRGDIHNISSRLDDVLDNIEATSQCLWLYEIRAVLSSGKAARARLVDLPVAQLCAIFILATSVSLGLAILLLPLRGL